MVSGRLLPSLFVADTFQAEMSIETKERGPEVAVQCAWLISGIAVAYWIDFGFTRLNMQISWVGVLNFRVLAVANL